MHLTTLEVTHSKTAEEIGKLVGKMKEGLPEIASHTYTHRARLVKPFVSYDLAAFALSFLPASGERVLSPAPVRPGEDDRFSRDDGYTYHHLRRDIFGMAQGTGVDIESRYVVPSAHITLGRYLTQDDHDTTEARGAWIRKMDEINAWLEKEVWDGEDAAFIGEWIVGQERGLDARCGPLWYGMGRTICVGEGF